MNNWQEHLNTRLDQKGFPLLLPHGAESGVTGVFAYSGGAPDKIHGEITFADTGGHADSAWNGVLVWSSAQLDWFMKQQGSMAYPQFWGSGNVNTQPSVNVYSDGTPASRHTYGNQFYDEDGDQVYVTAGLRWWDAAPYNTPWKWKQGVGYTVRSATRPGGYSGVLAWDRTLHLAWARHSSVLATYTPATDAWATLGTPDAGGNHTESSNLTIDTAGRKLYRFVRKTTTVVGGVTFAVNPSLRIIDISNPGAPVETIQVTTGDTEIETTIGANLVWDDLLPGLVAYGNFGTVGAMYTMAVTGPTAFQWVRQLPPNGIHPPKPNANGLPGSMVLWQGRYYLVTSVINNVWSVNPPWQSGQVGLRQANGLTSQIVWTP